MRMRKINFDEITMHKKPILCLGIDKRTKSCSIRSNKFETLLKIQPDRLILRA